MQRAERRSLLALGLLALALLAVVAGGLVLWVQLAGRGWGDPWLAISALCLVVGMWGMWWLSRSGLREPTGTPAANAAFPSTRRDSTRSNSQLGD